MNVMVDYGPILAKTSAIRQVPAADRLSTRAMRIFRRLVGRHRRPPTAELAARWFRRNRRAAGHHRQGPMPSDGTPASASGRRPVARYPIASYNVRVMDLGYRLLAAKYIHRQVKQLAEQLEGVRAAENVEFVHRARVATRRLRAALRIFDDCFTARQVRRWRKAISRTTRKLGDARDRDVQIECLCGALSTLSAKECFPGIACILVELERDRERLQRKVVRAVDRLEATGVLKKMRRTTKRILRQAASAAEDVQSHATYAQTEWHILRQLNEMLQHQDSLANPEDRQRHHAMRIAAKRLRYTLEIARPLHPGRLDDAVEATKRVQSLLGDVHDCDVWMDQLDAFAASQRRRIVKLFGHAGRLVRLQAGIDYLRRDRGRHRQEVFRQLVEYWAELGQQRLWEGLRAVLVVRGEAPADTAASAGSGSATATPTTGGSATATPTTGDSATAAPTAESPAAPPSDGCGSAIAAATPVAPVPKPLLTTGSW
jgi:CHAD domain-containing protein